MGNNNKTKAELLEEISELKSTIDKLSHSTGTIDVETDSYSDTNLFNGCLDRLLEVEERYKALFDRSLDSIFITDFEGNFLDANVAFLDLIGYSKEDFIETNISAILDPDEMQYALQIMEEIKATGKQDGLSEFRIKTKDGVNVYIECKSSAIIKDGKYYAVQTLARDISERKQIERIQSSLYDISESINTTRDPYELYRTIHGIIKELMPANNFYIALYDPISDMLSFPYYVDEREIAPEGAVPLGKGLTEFVLRAGENMLVDQKSYNVLVEAGEIDASEHSAKIWLGVALKLFGKTIGVMAVKDYNNENIYGERERQLLIFVSEQIALAIDKKRQEEAFIAFAQELQYNKDLLEERAAEFVRLNEQLEESEKELKELNASKDKFFSIIAHDLRSPFSGLLGFANILLEDFDTLSKEEIKNFTIHINTYTKNLFNLIENLLSWSRVQTGRMPYQPIRLDISETATNTINLLMGNCIKKNIALINEILPATLVYADPNMIQSVVQNLVSNAIKFTNAGGQITLSSQAKETFIEVSVSDTGVGMKEDDMDKIFRIDAHHTTLGTAQEKGTGLGLLLCKDLVEKHGGTIWVESTHGKGTTFRFTLPLYSEQNKEE